MYWSPHAFQQSRAKRRGGGGGGYRHVLEPSCISIIKSGKAGVGGGVIGMGGKI